MARTFGTTASKHTHRLLGTGARVHPRTDYVTQGDLFVVLLKLLVGSLPWASIRMLT